MLAELKGSVTRLNHLDEPFKGQFYICAYAFIEPSQNDNKTNHTKVYFIPEEIDSNLLQEPERFFASAFLYQLACKEEGDEKRIRSLFIVEPLSLTNTDQLQETARPFLDSIANNLLAKSGVTITSLRRITPPCTYCPQSKMFIAHEPLPPNLLFPHAA